MRRKATIDLKARDYGIVAIIENVLQAATVRDVMRVG